MPPLNHRHVFFHGLHPSLLPQTKATENMPFRCLCPQAFRASTFLSQAIPLFQPLTNVHLAVALETDALVLVALDSSGPLRGAVFGAGPQAGIALGATERRRVRCL